MSAQAAGLVQTPFTSFHLQAFFLCRGLQRSEVRLLTWIPATSFLLGHAAAHIRAAAFATFHGGESLLKVFRPDPAPSYLKENFANFRPNVCSVLVLHHPADFCQLHGHSSDHHHVIKIDTTAPLTRYICNCLYPSSTHATVITDTHANI